MDGGGREGGRGEFEVTVKWRSKEEDGRSRTNARGLRRKTRECNV